MRRFLVRFAAPLALLGVGTAQPAHAHAFGQRYDLPLPLGLFVLGAGLAVALSFVVVALGVHRRGIDHPRRDLLRTPFGSWMARPALLFVIRLASVVLFVIALAAGLFGKQDPFKNITPTLFWVIWWVGFAYLSALLGDVWRLVNPLAILFDWASAIRRSLPGQQVRSRRSWPSRLGLWPAVLLFFLFAWSEVVWQGGETPRNIALGLIGYAIVSWSAMAAFGRDTWLENGDPFARAFGLLARFAPTGYRRGADGRARLDLRPPAVGLLTATPVSPSLMGFVLLMLATVTFDGFRETPAWTGLLDWALESPLLTPILLPLHRAGVNILALLTTLGLGLFPLLFFLIYRAFCWMMTRAAGNGPDTGETARHFVLTLVPIALAYHLAHYLSLLLIAGQLVIPLASDPFGFGWDLFGTTFYRIRIEIVDARLVWYTAVAAIVLGHIAAVYLAHRIAVTVYATRSAALRSQIPMLVLMVGYTMVSLWILAQPVVQE